MVTWAQVEEIALLLSRARRGVAHEGSPTVDVGPHPFVRFREIDGRDLVQLWARDPSEIAAFRADPDRFPRVDVFAVKASVWARLDLLGLDEALELVVASWLARTGRRTTPPEVERLLRSRPTR